MELYFDDEKNLLDLRRLKNHTEQTVKGKVFVTFVSLIILARLRKMVGEIAKKKRKYWSEQDMLRKVETYAKILCPFEKKYFANPVACIKKHVSLALASDRNNVLNAENERR